MRLSILSLTLAALLGACGQSEPAPPAEQPIVIPQPPRIPEPAPEMTIRSMDALPADPEQARAQAEADRQALDRRAAELPAEIAGSRQQAEDAFRAARAPEPNPEPQPAPPAAAAQPAPAPAPPPAPAPSPSPSTPSPGA